MDLLSAIMWLTLNLYHEGRGEEPLAQVAIAHVTLNRAEESGKSMKKVILDPKQFSWTHTKKNWTPQEWDALAESFKSATVAMQGHDFTGGATHYHHKNVKPIWRKKMIYIGQFGSHKFYKKRPVIKAYNTKVKRR